MSYTILHNPRCRKSREALQLLQEKGIEPDIREYLKDPLSVAELEHVAELMEKHPEEFVRKGESEYKEYIKGRDLNDQQMFELMAKFPILMERPIVIKDDQKAVLGRPPEEVQKLLT